MAGSAQTTDSSTAAGKPREEWTGQVGFILAAIGSAVGLGNIWRFPGVAYENGGGAFLIPYLIALLTAGIPILFLDYAIGHRYRGATPTAFRPRNTRRRRQRQLQPRRTLMLLWTYCKN